MTNNEIKTKKRLETLKAIIKKSIVFFKLTLIFGIFCCGCYATLFIETSNNISIMGLVASVIVSIFSLICIRFIKEV